MGKHKNQGNAVLMFYSSLEMRETFFVLKEILGKDMQSMLSFGLKAYISQNRTKIHNTLWKKARERRENSLKIKEQKQNELDILEHTLETFGFIGDRGKEHRALLIGKRNLKNDIRHCTIGINQIEMTLFNYKKSMDAIDLLFKR